MYVHDRGEDENISELEEVLYFIVNTMFLKIYFFLGKNVKWLI